MPIANITQSWNDRIDIAAAEGPVATYRYTPALPKACFHPLQTPRGHGLTGFQMSDHVWHRGLWFTIKYINGKNFWEEGDDEQGVHHNDAQPLVELLDQNTLRLTHRLHWAAPATGKVFDERRVLTLRTLADGVRTLDWQTDLAPTQDLTLDRTPYTTWGGYGGLSFRGSREMHKAGFMLPDGTTTPGLQGQPHDWVVMHAQMDGGAHERVSIGLIDHPANPRSPSPWYGKCGEVNFINAAFLFHEKMEVPQGQTLAFRYRVCFRDGEWSRDAFADLADAFRKE